jgi:Transposase.
MDSDKYSTQIERLEVVDTGRRRRWSEDEKLKIVMESLQAPRQISATARRYGLSRSLLIRWRELFRAERHDVCEGQTGFVPVTVTASPSPVTARAEASGGSVIEIKFTTGTHVRITGTADAATVTATMRALSERRR